MRTIHQISYKGLPLDVVGYYTYEEQGNFSGFEIHEVWLGSFEISSLFDDYKEIETEILQEHY